MKFVKPALTVVALTAFAVAPAAYAATSPSLGTAASFSVLGETNITNVPTSSIGRDIGLSPATGANYSGITQAQVGGTIYAVNGFGPSGSVNNPGLLTTAINDMMNVWSTGGTTGLDQPCTTDWSGTGPKDLTTVSPLGPGVYCADAFLLTGNLTLSGTSGVWIFKSAATITTSSSSTVTGGDPCNVWWRLVSGGTIGTGTTFVGNILAGTSIGLQTGATLNGRALAQAAVTMDHNTISGPVCTSGSSGTTSTTPGLPNTGSAASQNSNSPTTIVSTILALALVSLLARRYSSKLE